MEGAERDSSAVVDLLRDLVKIDSVSGSMGERRVLDHLAAWLLARGVPRAEVMVSSEFPYLVAEAVPGQAGGLLILGHADTVPPSETEPESQSPLSGSAGDGRVYGRGSSDMKGGLAAAAAALVLAASRGCQMALIVTCSEELGCLGAASALASVESLRPAAVIVPESTGGRIARGHRGAVWVEVTTRGVAAHGSQPHLGKNAILQMASLLGRLSQVPVKVHPVLGAESLNVGTIRGGSATNIVADECRVTLDVRVVGDDASAVMEWLAGQEEVAAISEVMKIPAVWTEGDNRWVESLGDELDPPVVSYFTDAAVVQAALPPEVPIVICGPGDPMLVHGPQESVLVGAVEASVLQLTRAASLLKPTR